MPDILARIDQALTQCSSCKQRVDDEAALILYGSCYDCQFKFAGTFANAQIVEARRPRCNATPDAVNHENRRCYLEVDHDGDHHATLTTWPRIVPPYRCICPSAYDPQDTGPDIDCPIHGLLVAPARSSWFTGALGAAAPAVAAQIQQACERLAQDAAASEPAEPPVGTDGGAAGTAPQNGAQLTVTWHAMADALTTALQGMVEATSRLFDGLSKLDIPDRHLHPKRRRAHQDYRQRRMARARRRR